MTGPFRDEDEAIRDPRVQAIYARMRAGRDFRMQDGSAAMILAACDAAALEVGDYERRIIRWVAGFEPQSSVVFAALIERAAAGRPVPGGPRCGQCGALAEEYPDPYTEGRKLWRHVKHPAMGEAAGFLDSDHEAIPAAALNALNHPDKPGGTP